ncbi:DUF523 domain-containing protein [Enterococcus dongliensis]|uniref:DUF523 domain-containing protein n=1 Tax=Enterococcus dongliensis TaxID=2559925 RepID=A0AAP5KT71_9ENTE|nr:DUF523 domain-containing protein [Enterococcus dongliensis]MDT2596969.1 DUF523 domain-containing protein [Enterococcus dongliensis]MDT2602989.1 DUF523 domain-containing protein [Enterococcus dongliensis]MDT2612453.1 DUF523 domain-containing protein [Enterococcus dongliensis]MDT2633333.1 DUF523 domain-containing protein [Enterococcus dongliensis]MDT2636684.1 DUF523 domain-containing protein [Enterococcus dongliensis]
MLGISACLGGIACRYDGDSNEIAALKKLVETGQAIMICPEVLGGLPTPRPPAEIQGGDGFDVWQGRAKVFDKMGNDLTDAFKQGAISAYNELKKLQITGLVLKEKSPSCGSSLIYDGSFSGTRIKGVGVATAYFIQQGLPVYSEENWQEMRMT